MPTRQSPAQRGGRVMEHAKTRNQQEDYDREEYADGADLYRLTHRPQDGTTTSGGPANAPKQRKSTSSGHASSASSATHRGHVSGRHPNPKNPPSNPGSRKKKSNG